MAEQLVRVIVVVDWRRQRVHGITTNQIQAQRWTREIAERYGDDHTSATMTADVVIVSERAGA